MNQDLVEPKKKTTTKHEGFVLKGNTRKAGRGGE